MGKIDKADSFSTQCFENQWNDNSFIRKMLWIQVVKDASCIAFRVLHSLPYCLKPKIFRQKFIKCFIWRTQFLLQLFSFLTCLLESLLSFLNSNFKLLSSISQESLDFISSLISCLKDPSNNFIYFNHSTFLKLAYLLRNVCLARFGRTNDDKMKNIFWVDLLWILYLFWNFKKLIYLLLNSCLLLLGCSLKWLFQCFNIVAFFNLLNNFRPNLATRFSER